MQKLTGQEPTNIITKFVDQDAYIFERILGEGDGVYTSLFHFENSHKGAWLTFNEHNGVFDFYMTYDLERIPYPDLSIKGPDWIIDSLDGQKWICESLVGPGTIQYQYLMVFEKYNDEIKVRFTIYKYGHSFSSAEEAFASIDTYNSGTVTNINNAEHSITIELHAYSDQGKWKLYYVDSDYTGLITLSSSGSSGPITHLFRRLYYVYQI